jgi:hypothetical protein
VSDGEKLLKYFNSALNVLLGTDIFHRVPQKKLNFVAQCYLQTVLTVKLQYSTQRSARSE